MLKYTGGGYGGALPLIPARDLSDAEIAELQTTAHEAGLGDVATALVKSGIYRLPAAGEALVVPGAPAPEGMKVVETNGVVTYVEAHAAGKEA